MAYLFTLNNVRFIIKSAYSKIGCSYPNIFFECGDGSFLNLDAFLGTFFNMTKDDWDSWFDDSLITNGSLEEVCRNEGLNHDSLVSICEQIVSLRKSKG